jgi:putative endonuclease
VWPFGRASLGRRGERLARRRLRRSGLKILATNYRCPVGEVDLIALDASTRKAIAAETLVFVEVKTRTSDTYTAPAGAVDAEKRRRIRRIADYYLASRDTSGYAVRFDIVSIVIPDGEKPRVTHIPDAF